MIILPQWWRSYFLDIELGIALLVTVAFVAWAQCFDGYLEIERVLATNRGRLYGTLASIFAGFLGFPITAKSIVLGFSATDKLTIVRESSHYPTLWKVFRATIRSLGFATVVSLVGLVFSEDSMSVRWILYVAFGAFVLSSLRIIRTVWVLENVVGLLVAEPKRGK